MPLIAMPTRKAVEAARDRDHEHRQAVDDRRAEHEHLPPTVRSDNLPATIDAVTSTTDCTRVPMKIW